MTAPIPEGSPATQAIPDLVGIGVQELLSSAARLGLTWGMSLATVNNIMPLTATIDGDTASIGMISMVNGSLGVGSRVYVISVPPSGNFIVGQVNGGVPYRDRIITSTTTASVTFLGIPSDLRSITINCSARFDANGAAALFLRINGSSTAAQYSSHELGANSGTYITPATYPGSVGGLVAGLVCGNNNADEFAGTRITITGWNQPNPTGYVQMVSQSTGIVAGIGFFTRINGGYFTGAKPYSAITLLSGTGSFTSGCQFDLIGDPV